MRIKLNILLTTMVLVSACQIVNGEIRTNRTDKIVGFWVNKADSVWKYIYEFSTNNDHSLSGIVHSYYYGIKDSETQIEKIKNVFPEVILQFGAPSNMQQVFTIDTVKKTITSEMELPDQSNVKMVYHKLSSSQPDGIFPRKLHITTYAPPVLLDDGISVKDLSENRIIKQSIDRAISQIVNKDYGLIFSLLISHKNHLIVEEYFYDHTINTSENLSSVTKSIVALITMAAIDDHYIKGLDENINTYLDFNSSQPITIQNLLSMKAGMQLDEEEAWRYSDNRLNTLLNRKIINTPGTVLSYDNGIPNILNAIIFKATNKQADQYAADRLFKNIGISKYNWEIDKQNGFPDGSGTLQLASRDMLKIGLLVLNKGKWDGKTVVEEESINTLSERHTWFDEYRMGYGLLWWIKEIEVNNKPIEVIYASGSGGRFIIVIPELEIAAVLTGGNYDMSEHYKSWELLKPLISQIIKNSDD